MIFSICYNANTKIGKAERNTKFISGIAEAAILVQSKDRKNIPTAQQQDELFSVTISHRILLANVLTLLSVVALAAEPRLQIGPTPKPPPRRGLQSEPAR